MFFHATDLEWQGTSMTCILHQTVPPVLQHSANHACMQAAEWPRYWEWGASADEYREASLQISS
jgi:hypothetical protein